jgi:aminoglycoside/choline kinase family phosphotransferase
MQFTGYGAAELTPENITVMLRSQPQWHDVVVTDVACSPVGTGQMANSYRLELSYAETTEGAPSTVIAKVSSTDPASRQMAAASAAYQREVFFYQRLAGIAKTRTPQCYFAEIARDLLGFILLLEDMGPARVVDQLSGCTLDQADLALAQAAELHGPTWRHPCLREQAWLPVVDLWNNLAGSIPHIIGVWMDRFGAHLRPEHVSVVEKLGPQIDRWLKTVGDFRSLWHGDFRLDNMLFDAQGGRIPIAVIDWQSTATGPGIADVSYFLGNSLVEDDRAKHERDLLGEYHRRLVASGVEGYSAEQCWLEYRVHALYGLILTIPVSLGVETTERGDKMFAAMADRAADQILVNESFAALQAV